MKKKFGIELKWAFIFIGISLLWMVLERLTGLHDKYISKHIIYTNLFAIPAIIIFVLALLDKRKNFYNNKLSWLDGFLAGLVISIIITVFSPLTQLITIKVITPDFFPNMINYVVESGKMSQENAEDYFNLTNYMMQSALGGLLMGAITSAIVALFVRKK
ncbi:MAG: DUF4199 domain-containing protein [Draconibacterium sp.]